MEGQVQVREINDDGAIASNGHRLEGQVSSGNSVKGSENLDVELLEDFDSYMEDINDRLTISRMVSDAIIKGMVSAYEQEAAEIIAAKELEVACLKESLGFQHAGGEAEMETRLPGVGHENIDTGGCSGVMGALLRHDKMRESLHSLEKDARGQLMALKKDIGGIRGGYSFQRVGSGSEFVGLSGILEEKETESWVRLDKTVDSLEMTLNSICGWAEDMLQLSETSPSEWKREEDFKSEVETMVIHSSIRSFLEEFEEQVWDRHVCLCDSQTVNWLEKFNEISGLRKELDEFIKSLPSPPELVSHGSIDLLLPQTPRWKGNGNGKADESKTGVPDHFEAAQLNHLSKDGLVSHFNSVLLKMRRAHESEVQDITEKFFTLKGKYLSERQSVLPVMKGKEFDALRKKIPEVILKLDDILVESEKLPLFEENAKILGSLKNRVHILLAENHQLRDSLTSKKNELKCLTSNVSDASGKRLQYSLAETNLRKSIGDLSSSLEDAHIETSIVEEVYRCVLGELRNQIIDTTEESELKLIFMQDIYGILSKEATIGTESTMEYEIDYADLETMITQGLYGSILVETLKDAGQKFEELCKQYLMTNQTQVSLEMKVMEIESDLKLVVEEKERLREQVDLLSKLVEEKERLAMETSAALMKEREQVEQMSEELNKLTENRILLQSLLSRTNEEVDMMKSDLVNTQGQFKADQLEISGLNQKLERVMEELKEAGEQRNMVLALTREKEDYLSLFDAKDREHKKQLEAMISLVEGLSQKITHLEVQVTGDMKTNSLRLEISSSQLRSLIKKINVLKRTEVHYKHRLEKRCSDLQKAEAEVDLLGDEVDTLLNLLEKIYVALDHYSPVLQHYPGVIEILKLIRRELIGEPAKPI